MLKIKTIVSGALILINSVLFSQTVEEGPANQIEKGTGYHKLIGSDENSFYVLKRDSKGKGVHIFIEKINSTNYSVLFSKETKNSEIQEKMDFAYVAEPKTFLANGKVFVFFESHNKKTNQMILFLQTVSSEGQLSEVYEISSSYLKYHHPIDLSGRTFNKIIFSPDKKMFAVIPLIYETEKSDKKTCYIYDATTFQKKAEKKIPTNENDLKVICSSFALDNQGNLFFSITRLGTKKSTISGFAIGLYESTSPTLKTFPISLPENKVFHENAFSFKSLENGDLLIAGIISDTISKNSTQKRMNTAYFIKKIANNSLEVKFEQVVNFTSEVLETLEDDVIGNMYNNTEIFEISSEVYIVTQRTNKKIIIKPLANMLIPYSTIDSKELVVSKIDNNGKIVWSKVIPKYHAGSEFIEYSESLPRFSGNYKSIVNNGTLNFLYFDHPNNSSLDLNKFKSSEITPVHATAWGGEGIVGKDKPNVILISISNQGVISKKTIFEFSPENTNYVALGNTVMLNPEKLLIFLENRKLKIEKFAALNFK